MNANFRTTVLTVTPVCDTSATSAGDVLCPTIIVPGLLDPNFTGELVGVTVLDKADNGAALDVVLLNAETDLGTAGSAVSISDADAEDILRIVSITADDYVDLVGSQFADVDTGKPFKLIPNGDGCRLYLALIDRTGANTYAADSLVIHLHVRSDNPR